jgi:diguanylate cyclase (GGDEF)-like protein
MSSVAFFAEYLGRFLNIKYARALPLCAIGALAYLCSCAVTAFWPAPYRLPDTVSLVLRLTWGAVVFFVSCLVLFTFVREATKSEKVLSRRLMHDKLTGLPNRYYVSTYLERLSKGNTLSKYWVAIADIDDFKQVNDTYGHNCGDHVLENIAHLLQESLPDTQVCRWGGEEFLVMGPIGAGMEGQVELLDRARTTIAARSLWYDEQRVSVTITIGVAPYKSGLTITEWINEADKLLYEGKQAGKNRVVA